MRARLLQIRLRTLLLVVIPAALVLAVAAAVSRARTDANASSCHGSMAQIALGLLNYRELHGHFPPAAFTGAGGTRLHSWRVLLLADIEGVGWSVGVGRTYNMAQPWNSPGNRSAAELGPALFRCRNNQGESGHSANYVALIDRGVSSFERADAIPRGSPEAARQVLVIEYPNSHIFWTEPRDLDLDDLSRLSPGADPRGLGVVFADGHYERMALAELRALLGR